MKKNIILTGWLGTAFGRPRFPFLFLIYLIANLENLAKKIDFFFKKPSGVPRNPSFPL
jgi:hypothetical protein